MLNVLPLFTFASNIQFTFETRISSSTKFLMFCWPQYQFIDICLRHCQSINLPIKHSVIFAEIFLAKKVGGERYTEYEKSTLTYMYVSPFSCIFKLKRFPDMKHYNMLSEFLISFCLPIYCWQSPWKYIFSQDTLFCPISMQ